MTENMIAAALMANSWRKSLMLPRYTPSDWWECDVFELTASGYFREYEIKLTLSDFKADAEKKQMVYPRPFGEPKKWRHKHKLLGSRDSFGPVEFFYIVPSELVIKIRPILPEWAGLIEAWEVLNDKEEMSVCTRSLIRAPRLHTQKAASKIRTNLLSTCYYRFHNLRTAKEKSQ